MGKDYRSSQNDYLNSNIDDSSAGHAMNQTFHVKMLKKSKNWASPKAANNSELGNALKALSPRIQVRSESIEMSKLYCLRDKKLVIVEPRDMYPMFHRVYNMPVTSNFG